MKIARFIDQNGRQQIGIPDGSGSAELLSGDLFQPGVPTGEQAPISRLLAPLEPTDIYCIGLNYKAHAAEAGMELPRHPVVFMKPTSTLADPGQAILNPQACERGPELDYEAELCVVIGRETRNISVDDALGVVAGYTCANDVSARKWQMHGGGGQWVRGKSFDTFCPLGPVLTTADDIPDPQDLDISCVLNGETVQQGHTSDMIFSVAEIIAFLSRDTTLRPGTVILTGTPPGVGFARKPPLYLHDGDQVEVRIQHIGTLKNPVADA